MPAVRSLLSRLRGEERGLTLVEVVVAAMLATIVIGASAALFATADNSALGTQRQAQLLAVANQQIEKIRDQVKTNTSGFSALAMSCDPSSAACVPVPSGGSGAQLSYNSNVYTDPNHWVSSSSGCGANNEGYLIESNWDSSDEGPVSSVAPWTGCPTGGEPLLVSAGGIVTPYQTVTVGTGTATVYEYVTETYVGCAGSSVNSSLSACGSSTNSDARRLIVAVVPNNAGSLDRGVNSPQYMSTIFTNPVPSNQVNTSIGLSLGLSLG
jgi:type II secretory pathway pseudopilin PulG